MQTATSEMESKSRDLSICVHHYYYFESILSSRPGKKSAVKQSSTKYYNEH